VEILKFLSDQLKGYKNSKPSAHPLKALTPNLLRELSQKNGGPFNQASHQLVWGAFFFVMHSCEYLSITGEHHTQPQQLSLPLYDPLLALLANTITITFEFQKDDQHNDTVAMHCSGDPLLCPIHIWVTVVMYIMSYTGTSDMPHMAIMPTAYTTSGDNLT
jgi:hypothetical protein